MGSRLVDRDFRITSKSEVIQFDEKRAILQVEQKEEIWRERRDSNPRPPA